MANYPTDLTDGQWKTIENLFPGYKYGPEPRYSRRRVLDAIFYVAKTGCQWRFLPDCYPPFRTVHKLFRRWSRAGLFEVVSRIVGASVRRLWGKELEPSVLIVDSQSVKTSMLGGKRGVGGGKKVNGRKRHILVDTLGLIIAVFVGPANVHDGTAAPQLLAKTKGRLPRVEAVFADQAYGGKLIDYVEDHHTWRLEITSHKKDFIGKPSKLRWVVERTFAWLGGYRRLSKDYERTTSSSESWLYVVNTYIALQRLKAA